MHTRNLAFSLALVACGDGHHNGSTDAGNTGDAANALANALFVAREGTLTSFDLATGQQRPGEVSNVRGPVDLQVLDDGTVMVNLTGANQVLAIDPSTMLEKARIASSGIGATRPVHSFITPVYNGKRFWAVMNDGTAASDSSASFIDITPGSPTYLKLVGEVALGVGHHKATFSKTRMRMVASNIGDCVNVMSVYDFTDPAHITTIATLTGPQAGFAAADPGPGGFDPTFCDPTFARGLPPAPHGCGTSPTSEKAYCSITSSGDMVVVDLDAATPTFTRKPTGGSGGGFTHMHPGGRYAYTLQDHPREGAGGASCQVGQLVVTDTSNDTVVSQTALEYKGPSCTDVLAGTDVETDGPGRYNFTKDGSTLYVVLEGGFGVDTARVRFVVVLDTTDPAHPVQLPSIPVALTGGFPWVTRDGTGKHVYIVGNLDGALTEIDTTTKQVSRTIPVGAMPVTAGTYGTAEGPSEQTGPVTE
jgi:YVTN family beta-propeller protein